MADMNVILKYRRPRDSWLCPECDAENSFTYTSCSICGCGKFGTPMIVKAWSEADERPPAPLKGAATPPYTTPGRPSITGFGKATPAYTISDKSKPIFVDPDKAAGKPIYEPPKTHTGAIILWTMLIIIAIAIFAVWKINNG